MTVAVCWQHVVKQRKASRLGPKLAREHAITAAEAVVREIDYETARSFIVEYEWLGNVGAAKYCYGLYARSELLAVVCYTTPPSPNAYRTLLGTASASSVYQLCRGASAPLAPKWAGSKITSDSLRLLRRRRGARLVVAYADPAAGEIGTVYQAANAVYLGLTDSRGPGKYIILGVEFHARGVQKTFGSAAHAHLSAIDPEYVRIQRTRKHRYIFLLESGARRRAVLNRLAPLIRPYPKRDFPAKAQQLARDCSRLRQ